MSPSECMAVPNSVPRDDPPYPFVRIYDRGL